MQLEVKFKSNHPDAKLPSRTHGNRVANAYEESVIAEENARFERQNPEAYAAGYRAAFPKEEGTDLILGTGDTGYDLFCVEDKVIPAKGSSVVDTGIEVAYLSPGYWFKIESRSGLSFKHGILCHPGVIDNCYTGVCSIKLYNHSDVDYKVTKGDRIAQLVFYPVVEAKFEWTDEKVKTTRGETGFGASGK